MTTIARYDWEDKNGSHKNDIKWDESTGTLATCSGIEAYAQTIAAVVLTVRGELVTKQEAGIPYFSTIFVSKNYADQWASEVIDAVRALDFVSSIDSFTYEYDEKRKWMTYKMSVTTKDGSSVDVVQD